jgi:hypothetical protein
MTFFGDDGLAEVLALVLGLLGNDGYLGLDCFLGRGEFGVGCFGIHWSFVIIIGKC